MKNTQLDSLEFSPLYWPYDVITSELSETPRQVAGSINTFVTRGGTIVKRPGLGDLGAMSILPANREPVRLWYYETLDGSFAWYIASMRRTDVFVSGGYQLYYRPVNSIAVWSSVGSTRGIDESVAPHELVIQRGLAFIRGTPDATTGQKYSTIILDGSDGTLRTRLWGIPGPTVPCRMSGRTSFLAANITNVATALTLTTAFSPSLTAPYTIQIDDERIRVGVDAGTGLSTLTRGYDGTTATNHDAGAFVIYHDWAVSAHRVDVVTSWKYTYAWVSVTGQVSNRAPLETNPDLMSSATFPFFDQVPKMTVQGNADTTNIPTINIYRTQDGGGTFYYVGSTPNTGAGNITFEDKYLETGPAYGTTNDPIPDDLLDQGQIAPSLTSNTVPPTVIAPQVIGTDAPQSGSPLVSYAGRIWYAVKNYLFFSGGEEITEGVPEESFPAGIDGNYFKFQHPVVTLIAGENALYVFTTDHTYKISGSDKQTFNVKPILHNIGGFDPMAVTRMGDKIAFLSHDRRVCILLPDDKFEFVSEAMGESWSGSGSFSAIFSMVYYGEKDKDLLFLSSYLPDTPTSSRLYVYDVGLTKKTQESFWQAPWTVSARCMLVSPNNPTRPERYLYVGNSAGVYNLTIDNTLTSVDLGVGYDWVLRSHLATVPEGNHVNKLRSPGLVPVVARARFERTRFPGDRIPQVTFSYDDFWTDEQEAVSIHEPTVRAASKWYETLEATSDQVASRLGVSLAVYASPDPITIHTLTLTWKPDLGATE